MTNAHDSQVNPYTPDSSHTRLQSLAGSFRGPTRTFMEPYAPNDDSTWAVEILPVLGGRFVELDYAATIQGGPHAGRLLLAHHNGAFSAVWIDSFHTGTDAIVFTDGGSSDAEIVLHGGYTYEGERFGWHIHVRQPDPDHVEIDHVNLMPGRDPSPAIETRLTRNQ